MRIWVVTQHDIPYRVFLTEVEARMYAMTKWPNPVELARALVAAGRLNRIQVGAAELARRADGGW